MNKPLKLTALTVCAILLHGALVLAGDVGYTADETFTSKPAVDGVNGKLSFGASADDPEGFGVDGAMTIPLGRRFGLQIDGLAAKFESDRLGDIPAYATAAHLFWRDPSKGLLGVYGDYIHVDVFTGFDFFTAGVEGAVYLDRFTIDGIIGVKDGDLVDAHFFDRARLLFYPTDNLNLHIGHTYAFESHSFIYGGEWLLGGQAGAAASLFVDGFVDDGGDNSVVAGMRIYIGQRDKSLIRRHREDDPPSIGIASARFSTALVSDESDDSESKIIGPVQLP